jgi:hypothetical protein
MTGSPFPALFFGTPRKLPKASVLKGRVAVLDIAFASEASAGGFDKVTLPFITQLGSRLAIWVDHHDHAKHAEYASDPRFLLRTKKQHGACPELITEELVQQTGSIDTLVCHTDFDGLASAAKWIRGGVEPYPGCDDDARAIDTMVGKPSAVATRIDRALRGAGRDEGVMGIVVRHLARGLADASLWTVLDANEEKLKRIEHDTREIARAYRIVESKVPLVRADGTPCSRVAFIKTDSAAHFDKYMLLMIGQERADFAVLLHRDTLSVAAPFESGLNFLTLFGLSGGMPTVVSVPATRIDDFATKLGIAIQDLGIR